MSFFYINNASYYRHPGLFLGILNWWGIEKVWWVGRVGVPIREAFTFLKKITKKIILNWRGGCCLSTVIFTHP